MNEPQTNDAPSQVAPAVPTAPTSRGPGVKQIAVVVVILAVGVVVTALTSDVKRASEPGIALENDAPLLVEQTRDWHGGALGGLVKEEIDLLPKDTKGARRMYADPSSNQVYCTIILSGRDVTSIHRPQVCLTGQGWKIERETVETVLLPGATGRTLEITRLNAVRTEELTDGNKLEWHAVFVYWFVGKDLVTAHHWERIFRTGWDRVLHNTNHRWAYVLIHSLSNPQGLPGLPKRTNDETFELLKKFTQEIYPTLVAP